MENIAVILGILLFLTPISILWVNRIDSIDRKWLNTNKSDKNTERIMDEHWGWLILDDNKDDSDSKK